MSDALTLRRANLSEILDLRHAVLRAGLARDAAIFEGDERPTSRHYGAFEADIGTGAIACATLHLNQWDGEPAWQLRGMATAADHRGIGLGRRLLEFVEGDILSCNRGDVPRLLWCNARVPAVGFYTSMGWQIASKQFDIPTAGPHVKMFRRLPALP